MSYSNINGTIEKVNFFLSKLNINPENVDVNIYYNTKFLDRYSTEDLKIEALTYPSLPHHYNLLLREGISNLLDILAHESVHICQFERGDLRMSSDLKTVDWKGKTFYNTTVPYFDRPWEVEAINKTRKLVREWKRR